MKRTFLLSLIFVACTLACGKDYAFPDPSLRTILGTWQWEQSSGGFAGSTITKTSNPEQGHTIEFRRNGIYIKQSKKDTHKFIYTIEERSSIFSQDNTWQLELTKKGLGREGSAVPATISFIGSDSLLLSDECADCFINLYTRQSK